MSTKRKANDASEVQAEEAFTAPFVTMTRNKEYVLVSNLTGHTSFVTNLAISPDGQILASGSADQTIKLWSLATGQELRTLTGHTDVVSSVAFCPDGQTLVSGSWDTTIKIWGNE